jgi:hypothetical protein
MKNQLGNIRAEGAGLTASNRWDMFASKCPRLQLRKEKFAIS